MEGEGRTGRSREGRGEERFRGMSREGRREKRRGEIERKEQGVTGREGE